MEWMLRVQIERDENDEEMKAIAAEFKFDEEEEDLNTKLTSSGGWVAMTPALHCFLPSLSTRCKTRLTSFLDCNRRAAGRSKEGESESWFRNQKIMDKDREKLLITQTLVSFLHVHAYDCLRIIPFKFSHRVAFKSGANHTFKCDPPDAISRQKPLVSLLVQKK